MSEEPNTARKTPTRAGVLLVAIDPGDDLAALRTWYEGERIPAVLRVPGVTGVTKWEVVSRYVTGPDGGQLAVPAPPTYVVIYELDDVDVVRSEAFLDAIGRSFELAANVDDRSIVFRQRMSVPLGDVMQRVNPEAASVQARGMMVVSITPEPEFTETMHEWYDSVHLGELMSSPGFLRTRRFEALEGIPNFFALYELDAPEALESERFKYFSGRSFDQLPAIQQKVGPHMSSHLCDVYALID